MDVVGNERRRREKMIWKTEVKIVRSCSQEMTCISCKTATMRIYYRKNMRSLAEKVLKEIYETLQERLVQLRRLVQLKTRAKDEKKKKNLNNSRKQETCNAGASIKIKTKI